MNESPLETLEFTNLHLYASSLQLTQNLYGQLFKLPHEILSLPIMPEGPLSAFSYA